MTDCRQLLADYAQTRSEPAFRELVARYLDLVYSSARRLVDGDEHRAQDVAQIVFADLAQKAGELSPDVMLGGWLHRHTCFVAANTLRGERRRLAREKEAAEMNSLHENAGPDFTRLAPLLDETINQLDEADRTAILLRFFEQKDFRAVGQMLDTSEDAARMRVNRALDKLRDLLGRHGIRTTAGALGIVISTNVVQSAPVGLAVTISAAALAGTAVSTATVLTATTKIVAMTTLQKTLVTATVAVLAGAGIYEARQAAQLRDQVQALQQQQAPLEEQIGRLQAANTALSNHLGQADGKSSLDSDRLRELLRLRGEVGTLRRQQRELEQSLATAKSQPARPAGQTASQVDPQRVTPAPFQLQLVLDEPGEDSELMTNQVGTVAQTLRVQKTPLMNYTAIRSATVTTHPVHGTPQIEIEFNDVGKELFAAVTRENVNKRLAMVLDGQLYSAPVIRTEILGGKAQITGNFTEEEAKALAAKINEAVNTP